MRGHPLIQVEELVGLRAAARTVASQVLKAGPLPLMCCHERVQIHDHTVFTVVGTSISVAEHSARDGLAG